MPRSSTPIRALYRKYRPTSLTEVIGQEQVTENLATAIKKGKLGHAYLFIGPRGTGKTSVARIFAHEVNKFKYNIEDSYLDIIEIDAASNTGVDNIRELREKAIIAPSKGKYKVYIIDEVHMLSKSAANALLKTIEEPPEHVIFIMATTEANKVPITISSRTQLFTFKLAEPATMLAHLKKISTLEKIPINDEALAIIVRRGGGSFRDSLSLLDQIATIEAKTITADLVTQALGLPTDAANQKLLSAYQTKDLNLIQETLRELFNTGISATIITSELLSRIVASPTPALLPLLTKLTEVEPPFPEAKLLLALLSNVDSPDSNSKSSTPTPIPAPPKKSPKLESAPEPEPALEPVPTPTPTVVKKSSPKKPSHPTAFDWEDFLSHLKTQSNATFLQVKRCEHEFDGVLHIYPPTKISAKILQKPESHQAIATCLDDTSVEIHDFGDYHPPEDATISQISAIMGEVREINEDLPF